MALDPDLLIDRRRLKRSRGLWRGAAVVALIALVAAFVVPATLTTRPNILAVASAPVVRLTVRGTITDDRDVIRAVDAAGRNPAIRAMILSVDSPGGTVAGGEALHAALTRFRDSGKSLVAVMGGTAASAAYMISMPAERIFARDSTVTGSIGVLMQSFNVEGLLNTLGVRAETMTSGPLKAQPNPFGPTSEAGRQVLQGVVDDIYGRFVAMVAQGRNMPEARVRELADGRIYTGHQALALNLVDAIGGEREARAWLREKYNIPTRPEAREIDTTGARPWWRSVVTGAKSLVSEGLAEMGVVDGAVALWQPGLR